MPQPLRERLREAEELLQKKEDDYRTILAAYEKTDGGIDREEAAELAELAEIIKMNREVISDAYFDRLQEIKEFDPLEEPDVFVPPENYKYGEVKRFDHNDFYNIFDTNVKLWALENKIALNSVTSAANFSASESTFQLTSLLPILLAPYGAPDAAWKVGHAIGKLLVAELEKGIRSEVKNMRAGVDVHALNKQWQAAHSDFAKMQKWDRFYEFIDDWKNNVFQEDMRVPGDDTLDYIGADLFEEACRTFPEQHLPRAEFFQKRFLQVALSQVANDDLREGADEAGDAEIHFCIENYTVTDLAISGLTDLANDLLGDGTEEPEQFHPKFVFTHGQIDDASAGLLRALKLVYGKETKVSDLPVLINVTIYAGNGTTYLFSVKRKNMSAGNTHFELTNGKEYAAFYDAFINERMMDSVTVGQLVYDS